MSNIKDLIINSLVSTAEQIGETALVKILQDLHDSKPDQYKAAIFGGHALVTALLPVVAGTATKIDDAIIQALSEAIVTSAAANSIQL